MWRGQYLVCVLMEILPLSLAIVGAGRDLVLTPKQTHQLNGKRIYYAEEPQPQQLEQSPLHSWERTLKHVTYVTLFTDAAMAAAAGNVSQLHDYHDFLQAPYVPAAQHEQQRQSRFGDIVTLASGRLEQLASNGSYRFVEGNTDIQQAATSPASQTRALWRVQRIRHREGTLEQGAPQRFHYELKYSVSPLTANLDLGWPPQSYIQRESDYPQSFGRHAYEEKRDQVALAQRRLDRQPQATFVRGIFQAPHPAGPPNVLNIGEYLKEDLPKGTPKLELFPGLFNVGRRPNFIPATTFRPSYPVKFGPPTPQEPYTLPNELSSAEPAVGPPVQPPVTHHFHHHFYMSPNGLADGGASGHADLSYRPATYVPEFTTPAPVAKPGYHQHGPHRGLPLSVHRDPASAESLDLSEPPEHEDQERHPLVRVPEHYAGYEQTSKYHTSKLSPLLIYAAAGGGGGGGGGGAAAEAAEEQQEDQKSFMHSEPLEETIYRYSEPDPLYVHQHPVDVLQLETPQNYAANAQRDVQQHHHEHPEPTQSEHDPKIDEDEDAQQQHLQPEQRPAGSQKQPKLATTAAPPTPGSSTTTESTMSTAMTSTRAAPTSQASFVSTSTSLTPLRALSRYRTTPRITAGRSTTTTTSTTTTEQPAMAKWKQRRKDNSTGQDSRAKSSYRHESKVAFLASTAATAPTTTTTATTPTTTTTPATTTLASSTVENNSTTGGEVIEVLTQKSVSKSVSIKVGENGEEIPIIVDDIENEVKRS